VDTIKSSSFSRFFFNRDKASAAEVDLVQEKKASTKVGIQVDTEPLDCLP
jgi:hypothetical protein